MNDLEERNNNIVIGITILSMVLFGWATFTFIMPMGHYGNVITIVVGVAILTAILGLDKLIKGKND